MTEPQAPKHTALRDSREAFEVAFYDRALFEGAAGYYPMGIKALRVGDVYDVRYGRLNSLWEGWQLRDAIEPDPSSSAQEVRAALEYCAYVIELAGLTGQGLDALQQARKALAFDPPTSKGDRT